MIEDRRLAGFWGKPALAIGMLLLPVLTVDEFRAALAHEFYHLRRGDAFLDHAQTIAAANTQMTDLPPGPRQTMTPV